MSDTATNASEVPETKVENPPESKKPPFWQNAEFWQGLGGLAGILVVSAIIILIVFRIVCVTSVENYEMCYTFNRWSGEVKIVDEQGWVVRMPFINAVHVVDLRPRQITISANKRVLNAKLCRFNPKGFDTFMEWHGRGAEKDLDEILKCYAFDSEGGKDCPFLIIDQDITANQAGGQIVRKGKDGGKQ